MRVFTHIVTAVTLVVVTVPMGACGRSGDSGAELPWEEPPPTTELPRSAEEATARRRGARAKVRGRGSGAFVEAGLVD